MSITYSIILAGSTVLFLWLSSRAIKNHSTLNTKYKKLVQQQVKGAQLLKHPMKGCSKLIKAKLKNNSSYKKLIKNKNILIHYNQYYLQEPSDIPIIQKVINQQNYHKGQVTFVDLQNQQFVVKQIKRVCDDLFLIQKSYQQHQTGIFKKIYGGLCYYMQLVFDCIRKYRFRDQTIYIPSYRRPFFMGPIIGTLSYTINLLTDCFFVLEVNFQNDSFVVDVIAESKSSLLRFYQFQMVDLSLQSFLHGLLGTLFGYMLICSIKTYIQNKKKRTQLQKSTNNILNITQCQQNKACVICLNNCRNVLFFDCKHLIVCRQCLRATQIKQCPVCKAQISKFKIILDSNQQNYHQFHNS